MVNKWLTVLSSAIFIVFSIYVYVLRNENAALKAALTRYDGGYERFLSLKVGGKRIADHINPQRVSVFPFKDEMVACGVISSGLIGKR